MQKLLIKLIRSWQGPNKVDRTLLAQNFEYYCGSTVNSTEVWLGTDNSLCPLDDLEIVSISSNGNIESAIFIYTDPVTLLKHKTTWEIHIEDRTIIKLIELEDEIQN